MSIYLRSLFALALSAVVISGCDSEVKPEVKLRQVEQAAGGAGGAGPGCTVATQASDCNDNNACTNDVCNAGVCENNTITCADDDNACTSDACDIVAGCSYPAINDGGACDDDNDACTNDVCNAGVCEHDAITCADDNNACTSDACDPVAGCSYPASNEGGPCDDDNNACTNDVCNAGVCEHDAITCADDNNVCTSDACDIVTGCSYPAINEGGACDDDNNVCTTDVCTSGTCAHNPITCADDNNVCTSDACDPVAGCAYPASNEGGSCDDQVDCTENDMCSSGVCGGSPDDSLCPGAACGSGSCDAIAGCGFTYFSSGAPCDLPGNASPDDCDIQDLCNGTSELCPTDNFQPNGTECVEASCTNGVATAQATCDNVNPACPAPVVTDCGGFACDGVVCFNDCTSDTQCLDTHYCDLVVGSLTINTCIVKEGLGGDCSLGQVCAGGTFCADGVCCSSPCNGQCESCNAAGECVAVPAGQAPVTGSTPVRSACTDVGGGCGGTCNGVLTSSCEYPALGEVCVMPSCDSGTSTALEASTCNGSGVCITPPPTSCSPYVCDATACHGDCVSDAQCEGDLHCSGGVCVPRNELGTSCTLNSQCDSGYCVDGVCCDGACGNQCEACNLPGIEGSCRAVTGAPVGSRAACGGTGLCAGSCDGINPEQCAFPGTDTECRSASCSADTAVIAANCNGQGQCPAEQGIACEAGCEGLLCAGAVCAVNADCEAGEICLAGICAPQLENGGGCDEDSDCGSGFCVDGVCCDGACSGQCEACDVAGLLGTCSPVTAGGAPHGGRQACTSDGSACAGSCDGTTRDSCNYPVGDECRTGMCSGGLAQVAAQCVGNGRCPAVAQQDCGSFACDAAMLQCDGPCAADPNACASGEYCSAGICVALKVDGLACGGADECTSGNCIDGVCCESACDSQCAACNVTGREGKCSATEGATEGARAACAGGGTCAAQCDGTNLDSCSFPGEEVSCGAASCSGGAERAAAACDGGGRCQPGEATQCPTLLCEDDKCVNNCATDDECLGDLVCIKGQCQKDPFIQGVDKGSCGCRMVGGDQPSRGTSPWLLLLSPALLLMIRRRRQRAA